VTSICDCGFGGDAARAYGPTSSHARATSALAKMRGAGVQSIVSYRLGERDDARMMEGVMSAPSQGRALS
jgi:hypothetical protein